MVSLPITDAPANNVDESIVHRDTYLSDWTLEASGQSTHLSVSSHVSLSIARILTDPLKGLSPLP